LLKLLDTFTQFISHQPCKRYVNRTWINLELTAFYYLPSNIILSITSSLIAPKLIAGDLRRPEIAWIALKSALESRLRREALSQSRAKSSLPGSHSSSTASPSPTSLFYTDPYSEDGEEDDLELLPEGSGPSAQQQRREEGGTSISVLSDQVSEVDLESIPAILSKPNTQSGKKAKLASKSARQRPPLPPPPPAEVPYRIEVQRWIGKELNNCKRAAISPEEAPALRRSARRLSSYRGGIATPRKSIQLSH